MNTVWKPGNKNNAVTKKDCVWRYFFCITRKVLRVDGSKPRRPPKQKYNAGSG